MNRANRTFLVVVGVAVTTSTGCSFRTELDYSKYSKTSTKSSVPATGDQVHYKSSFHAEAEGRINDARSKEGSQTADAMEIEAKSAPAKSDEVALASTQIIVRQFGPTINITNNVHIGDTGTHTQVYITPLSPTTRPELAVTPYSAPSLSPHNNDQCERHRRQHEATVRKWRAFFE